MTPTDIAEYLTENFLEFGDLDAEELLLQQESVLSYIKNNRYYDEGTSDQRGTRNEPEFTHNESQMAMDEALARSLHDLGDNFNDVLISDHGDSAIESRGSISRETPTRDEGQHSRENGDDADGMTSEAMQSQGESVGSKSKGLQTDLMTRLPTFKYKTRMLSKKNKKEKEECVICCSEYKNGVELTALPCEHHYHSDCINEWLQQKKHCPVCQKEVGGR